MRIRIGVRLSSRISAPRVVYPDVEQPERDEGGAPPPAQMPPGHGMTYAMEQPDPYWDNHAAIQSSMQQYRNAALLYPAFRGGS